MECMNWIACQVDVHCVFKMISAVKCGPWSEREPLERSLNRSAKVSMRKFHFKILPSHT
jgi:hypothetical protein